MAQDEKAKEPTVTFQAKGGLLTDPKPMEVHAGAGDIQPYRQKWCVVHADAPFLDRSDQIMMPVLVAAQDGGKQSDQGFALEGSAFVIPSAVAGDAQIHVAAERRVPAVYGGKRPLGLQLGRQSGGIGIGRRHGRGSEDGITLILYE